MNKQRRSTIIKRQQLLEQKVYNQRRSHKHRLLRWKSQTYSKIQSLTQEWKDTRSVSLLYKILPISKEESEEIIKIPRRFSFQDSHDECVAIFAVLVSSLHHHMKDICLDFSDCEDVSVSTMSLLYILLHDYSSSRAKQRKKKSHTKLSIIPPKRKDDKRVLKFLKIFDIYDYKEFTPEDGEFLKLPVIAGKFRNSFVENRKATAAKKIVEFINQSCLPAKKMLSKTYLNL